MKSRSGSPNKAPRFPLSRGLGRFSVPAFVRVGFSCRTRIPCPKAGAERPTWRAGDRWLYTWTAGTAKGVKRSEALGVRELRRRSNTKFFAWNAAHLFHARLHWAWAYDRRRVAGYGARDTSIAVVRLASRSGERVAMPGRLTRIGNGRNPMRDSYRVIGLEKVMVPTAGTFEAYQGRARGEMARSRGQYWYAPRRPVVCEMGSAPRGGGFQEVLRNTSRLPRLVERRRLGLIGLQAREPDAPSLSRRRRIS